MKFYIILILIVCCTLTKADDYTTITIFKLSKEPSNWLKSFSNAFYNPSVTLNIYDKCFNIEDAWSHSVSAVDIKYGSGCVDLYITQNCQGWSTGCICSSIADLENISPSYNDNIKSAIRCIRN